MAWYGVLQALNLKDGTRLLSDLEDSEPSSPSEGCLSPASVKPYMHEPLKHNHFQKEEPTGR